MLAIVGAALAAIDVDHRTIAAKAAPTEPILANAIRADARRSLVKSPLHPVIECRIE